MREERETVAVAVLKELEYLLIIPATSSAEALRKYAEEKGQTITTATERILKAYLDDHFKNNNQ